MVVAQVVLNHGSPGTSTVMGVTLPTKVRTAAHTWLRHQTRTGMRMHACAVQRHTTRCAALTGCSSGPVA